MSFGLQSSILRPPWDTRCALQPQMKTLGCDGAACSRAQNMELGKWTWQQDITQTQGLHTWVGFLDKVLFFTNASHTSFDFWPSWITNFAFSFLVWFFNHQNDLQLHLYWEFFSNTFFSGTEKVLALKFIAYFHLTIAGEYTFHLRTAMCSTMFF